MSELEEFLETVIPLQEAADLAMHKGDPEPRFALWSHEDPVSVLGAAGGSSIGWAEVSETFRWVAAKFTDCEWKIAHRHGDDLVTSSASTG